MPKTRFYLLQRKLSPNLVGVPFRVMHYSMVGKVIGFSLRLILALACLSFGVLRAHAQFDTIIDVPPNIAPPSIGSNTQLNLSAGGVIDRLAAGMYDGTTTNIEVNISGGTVDFVSLRHGSVANISDGAVRSINASGSSVTNISGDAFVRFLALDSNDDFIGKVNIRGGSVGDGFEVEGGLVNISGGSIGDNFKVFEDGGIVDISGGVIGDSFKLDGEDGFLKATITGGSIGNSFLAADVDEFDFLGGSIGDSFRLSSSRMNIFGGIIGDEFLVTQCCSRLNIYGGTIGERFTVGEDSQVNLFGLHFELDGEDLSSVLPTDTPVIVNERNVTLSGVFADGTEFAFDLSSFDRQARLNVTLLSVPEPASGLLVALMLVFTATRFCTRTHS